MRRIERRPAAVAVALAVLLGVPSLGSGLMLDDHTHIAALRGDWPIAWWDLFRFLPGDPAQTSAWIARGPLPWWTDPSVKIAFFRPVSAALIRIDWALFGRAFWLYHAHSLVWTAGWVLAAWVVLRAALPSPLRTAAILFFAVAPAHWAPVYWLASRNAIVASVLAYVALSLHVGWRERRRRAGAFFAPALVGLALLSGETALGALGYFIAYEALAAPRRGRKTSLAGVAIVVVVWLIVYRSMGAGTHATGFYADPLGEPAAFLRALPLHAITQLGTIVLLVPSHVGVFDPRAVAPQVVVGLAAAAAAVALTRVAAREASPDERRAVLWLGLGGLLSVVPGLASSPGPRALAVGSLGFAAVVAFWAVGARRAVARNASSRSAKIALWAAVGLHGVVPLLYWPAFALFSQAALRKGRDAAVAMPVKDAPEAPLVVVTVSDPPTGLYLPFVRAEAGLRTPSRYWLVSLVPAAHRVKRIDRQSFDVTPIGRRFLDTPFEKIFRRRAGPRVGESIRLEGASVTIVAEDGGAPTTIRVVLDVALEDASVVAWTSGRYERLALAVGEERVLAR